jgi:hypothetical protein
LHFVCELRETGPSAGKRQPDAYTDPVHVGTLELVLRVHGAESLKDRRRVVRALTARLRNKFNAAVADLEQDPAPHSARVGVACVANDGRYVDGQLTAIVNFVEALHLPLEVVSDAREIVRL